MRQRATGQAHNAPRRRLACAGQPVNVMFASSDPWNCWIVKSYAAQIGPINFLTLLAQGHGTFLAQIESDILGRYRTGAASAVAMRYLAPHLHLIIAIVGAGRHAYTQALALFTEAPESEFRITSRLPERAEHLASILRAEYKINAITKPTVREAIAEANVIVTATTSKEPVIASVDVPDQCLIIAMGANDVTRTELPCDLIGRASRIVVDDLDVAHLDCGDLIQAAETGSFAWDTVEELSGLVERGCKNPVSTGLTIFESQGLALWDLAAARVVWAAAQDARLGKMVDTFQDWPTDASIQR